MRSGGREYLKIEKTKKKALEVRNRINRDIVRE